MLEMFVKIDIYKLTWCFLVHLEIRIGQTFKTLIKFLLGKDDIFLQINNLVEIIFS